MGMKRDETEQTKTSVRWRLMLASTTMLFVELALIRWTGANVVHLSYFSNFVLLGSFLGHRLGFLRSRPPADAVHVVADVLALLVVFVLAFPVQVAPEQRPDPLLHRREATGLPAWLTLPLIFLAVAAVDGLHRRGRRRDSSRTSARSTPTGSTCSAASPASSTFTALSFLRAPPLVWG